MPERTIESTNYRYGFNGKEKDPETQGEGNQYDYGFRIYNPRIGRFLSVDKYKSEYPGLSTYNFAGLNPVYFKDNDGKKITDPSGKEITFKESNGQLVFSDNADVYSKIAIAALYMTQTGKSYLTKLQEDDRKIAFINPPSDWEVDEDGVSTIYGEVEPQEIVSAYIKKQELWEKYNSALAAENKLSDLSSDWDDAVKAVDNSLKEYEEADKAYSHLIDSKYSWDENKGVSVRTNPYADLYILIDFNSHVGLNVVASEKGIELLKFRKAITDNLKGKSNYTEPLKYIALSELINTLVEEAVHTQQKEFNYYEPEYDQGSKKYKKSDKTIDYEYRKHEVDAKKEANNAENEYKAIPNNKN